ncbi:MAG: tryptophan synthase subunit alpha [Methanomicrobiales archaeon]|nr:tryptophan synthase subunit alpha [Methanomicrobiales archaeon]
MNRIQRVFHPGHLPVFIAFIVAGDPDPATSITLAKSVIDGGADILELGVPFSDPVADGPTIQRADERAIAAGMTTDGIFAMIRAIREYSDIPLVLLVYCNSVYARGITQFYDEAAVSGLDGILIVDMPAEESDEALVNATRTGIDQIFLVAETTSEERLQKILRRAKGFLYLVSRLGVTGVREGLSPEIGHLITRVKGSTRLPLAVGFGISRPEEAHSLIRAGADAVIVGSAIVERIEQNHGDLAKSSREVKAYVSMMKKATSR